MARGRAAESSNGWRAAELVLIDEAPLRAGLAADCSSTMQRLERARAGWHHFERKDKPAFIRWRAREFGALLSTARDVETRIRDSQNLIHEVEMEMRRGFQDAFSAYQRVMARRTDPSTTNDRPEPEASSSTSRAARPLSDFEKEALFQEWVKRSLGTHPDKMDDEAYASSFEAFKSHMFRPVIEETRSQERRTRPRPRPTEMEEEAGEEEPAPIDARVKALYRRLVRRLHPDLRADGSATVSMLWHEVQEAYAASDVARMEILLALSDIEAQRTHDQSISQMQLVLADLDRSLRALEKNLEEAEGEDAWDFARIGPTPELRLRVERQLQRDLAARTRRLELLTRTLAEWAAGPIANRAVFA
jgi:hypothetical protein